MSIYSRVAIIKELGELCVKEGEALFTAMSPFIKDICLSDIGVDYHLAQFYKICAFAQQFPAEQRKEFVSALLVLPFINDKDENDQILSIFAQLPAEKWKDFANAVGPLVQKPGERAKIIKAFAEVPAEEWETLSAVVHPFINNGSLYCDEIIHTFARLPAEKREDFANAVRPLVKGKYGSAAIIREFAKAPAEKWNAFSNIMLPFAVNVKTKSFLCYLIQVFVGVPAEKWEKFANAVRCRIVGVESPDAQLKLIRKLAQAPEEWDPVKEEIASAPVSAGAGTTRAVTPEESETAAGETSPRQVAGSKRVLDALAAVSLEETASSDTRPGLRRGSVSEEE